MRIETIDANISLFFLFTGDTHTHFRRFCYSLSFSTYSSSLTFASLLECILSDLRRRVETYFAHFYASCIYYSFNCRQINRKIEEKTETEKCERKNENEAKKDVNSFACSVHNVRRNESIFFPRLSLFVWVFFGVLHFFLALLSNVKKILRS